MESICPSRTKSPTPGTELEASSRLKADLGRGRRLARIMLRAKEAKTAKKEKIYMYIVYIKQIEFIKLPAIPIQIYCYVVIRNLKDILTHMLTISNLGYILCSF